MDDIEVIFTGDVSHRQLRSSTVAKRKRLHSPSPAIPDKRKKISLVHLQGDNASKKSKLSSNTNKDNKANDVKFFPIFRSAPKNTSRNETPQLTTVLCENAEFKPITGKTKVSESCTKQVKERQPSKRQKKSLKLSKIHMKGLKSAKCKVKTLQSCGENIKVSESFKKEVKQIQSSKKYVSELELPKKRGKRKRQLKKVGNISETDEVVVQTVCLLNSFADQKNQCSSNNPLAFLSHKNANYEKHSECSSVKKCKELDVAPFPKFSHCQQLEIPLSEVFVENSENLTTINCIIPAWNEMIGLIDVPKDALLFKNNTNTNFEEDTSKCFSGENNQKSSQINFDKTSPKFNARTGNGECMDIELDTENDNLCENMWTDTHETERYRSMLQDSGPVKLREWFMAWKSKFDNRTKKHEYCDIESDEWSDDDDDDNYDGGLLNCVIVTGAPGTGKTSLVSCLAADLGYKVLEVNASSCRSGRHISSTLREAFQSYHVEHPAFSSFSSQLNEKLNSTECHEVDDELQITPSPKRTVKSSNSAPVKKQNSSIKKSKNDIRSFFCGSDTKAPLNDKVTKSQNSNIANTKVGSIPKKVLKNEKISNLSMILFDDVDVVLEEDDGFWTAINAFLKSTKKPVVLTATRNLGSVAAHVNIPYEMIDLKNTNKDMVAKSLELTCGHLQEDLSDLRTLSNYNANDIRRSLLDLQFLSKKNNNSFTKQPSINSNKNETFTIHNLVLYPKSSSSINLQRIILYDKPLSILQGIIQHHSSGFDLLHNNLFSLLSDSNCSTLSPHWNHVTCKTKEQISPVPLSSNCTDVFSDDTLKPEVAEQVSPDLLSNCMDDSDSTEKPEVAVLNPPVIPEDTSKLCKSKFIASSRNLVTNELFYFANVLENFSFSESIKGNGSKQLQWLSTAERLKKWCCGSPTCVDDYHPVSGDFTLDLVSTINIFSTREALQNLKVCHTDLESSTDTSYRSLALDHPLHTTTDLINSLPERQIQCVISAIPALQRRNLRAITLDYLSSLKNICRIETGRQLSSLKRRKRFLHYFDSISLPLESKDLLTNK